MCPWPSLQSEGFSPTLRLDFNRSEGKGGQLYPCEPALRAWALYLGLADPSPWPSHHFLPDCGTVSPRGLPYPSPHPTWLTSLPCPQTICGSLVPQRGSLEIGKKEALCSQGMWVHIMAPPQTNGVTSPSPSTLPCLTFSICKMEQGWCLLHQVMGRVHVLTPHGECLGQCQLVILSITNTGERSSPSSSSGRGRGVLGPPRPTCTAPISLFPSAPKTAVPINTMSPPAFCSVLCTSQWGPPSCVNGTGTVDAHKDLARAPMKGIPCVDPFHHHHNPTRSVLFYSQLTDGETKAQRGQGSPSWHKKRRDSNPGIPALGPVVLTTRLRGLSAAST